METPRTSCRKAKSIYQLRREMTRSSCVAQLPINTVMTGVRRRWPGARGMEAGLAQLLLWKKQGFSYNISAKDMIETFKVLVSLYFLLSSSENIVSAYSDDYYGKYIRQAQIKQRYSLGIISTFLHATISHSAT